MGNGTSNVPTKREAEPRGCPTQALPFCGARFRPSFSSIASPNGHGVIVVVVVVVTLVVVVVQAAQQVVPVPTVPPAVWQLSAEEAMLHSVPQSLSAVQLTLGALVQVPFAESQVLSAVWHVTVPGLPQVDRTAQRMIRPTHGWGTAAWAANCPNARATHLR